MFAIRPLPLAFAILFLAACASCGAPPPPAPPHPPATSTDDAGYLVQSALVGTRVASPWPWVCYGSWNTANTSPAGAQVNPWGGTGYCDWIPNQYPLQYVQACSAAPLPAGWIEIRDGNHGPCARIDIHFWDGAWDVWALALNGWWTYYNGFPPYYGYITKLRLGPHMRATVSTVTSLNPTRGVDPCADVDPDSDDCTSFVNTSYGNGSCTTPPCDFSVNVNTGMVTTSMLVRDLSDL